MRVVVNATILAMACQLLPLGVTGSATNNVEMTNTTRVHYRKLRRLDDLSGVEDVVTRGGHVVRFSIYRLVGCSPFKILIFLLIVSLCLESSRFLKIIIM